MTAGQRFLARLCEVLGDYNTPDDLASYEALVADSYWEIFHEYERQVVGETLFDYPS
ncbi:TPA_asm: hypothetical protein [ssRNA phage SRR7976357_3]|uniref:Uncharacterized protein n=1 Tax=ssRNA phage SRR7976357_3 TaxID=2786743 RepID=A0A8S5L0Z6_9VIRU|nr:hypothetical protein QII49_gp3 [ssRNA phage SRR7976357_3]DAD51256.1 TPA_asm: hypothetical protein [ssRNA phage SRR7976357_3]